MDGFCNTSFWNTSSSWDTVVPSVSPCFEHTVLVWLPCSFAWLLGICEASILVHSDNRENSYSTLFVTKLIFQALTFIVCTAKLVVSSLLYLRYATDLAEVAGCSVLICTLVLVTGLTLLERRKGLRSSLAIPTFWLLFAICMAITFYADVVNFTFDLQNVTPLCSFLLLLLTVVQLVLSSLSEKPPPYAPLERQPHQCVLKEWTIIPRIFFAHMWRIVMLGYHGKLDVSTLHQLCTDLTCATTFREFHKAAFMKPRPLRALVDEQGSLVRAPQTQEKKQRSLYWVVFRVCWFQLLASTVLEVIGVFVSFLPPYMLSLILTFVQSKEYTWHGYVYACGYAGFLFLSGVLDAHAVYFTEFAAFRAQSSLLAALYRKVFRLAPSARRHYLAGDVMNFMSVDVEEVSSFLTLSTQVWTVPLRIVLTLVLLRHYLGASCLATLGVMFAAVLATTYVATLCDRYQEKQMALKDKRMRQISEILNGIKVLKLSGWEVPFMERVQQTRLQEVSYLRKFSLLDSVFGFLWTCAPYLAALASFATFLAVNPSKQLTPEIAFVSLALFGLLRFPMGILPDVISKYIRFVVSMGRLAKFLGEAELDRNAVGTSPEQGHSVTLKNATLSWSREEAPVLKDLTLSVKTGSLVAVVGSVGSGKSSLLSAILGTLEKVSGTIDVEGRLAYVPQQSWIQNATVKGNVVFMNRLDEDRYREVIESCALLPDLEILPGGENTEIGEKGINLSGGQKLRLSLARAVYHDADVYLLDDPFSAVDVHVAAHLFEHVVGPTGILKSKTRILVTHSVTYLPQVDWIVLLNHGVVQEQGTYADLVGREGSKFAEFIQHHVKAHPSANSLTAANGSRNRPVDEQKTGVEADKCTLVEEETLCTGYVGSHVYGMYFKRVGWRFLIPALITCILAFGSEYGSAVWLSKWSQDGDVSRRHFYITGYALFLASYVVFNFVFWSIFVVGTLRAAIWFHQQLLNGILRSPLSFFDTTPMGRIINRFSRDVESVDKEIPINANMTMCNIVWGMQLLILICIMSPYFTIVVVMAVLLFASVTIVSLPAFRQVQRLRSVTRSPILTHISESIAGVVSVRAFGVTKQFINALERRVDVNINCCYHSISLDCCRLTIANTLALVVSLGASLLTIAGRNSLSPGMIGLVLSYTLEVSNAASYTFRMFALLETSLVAVERIKEYIGLTEEAPWRNADSQPDADWPARGNIVYSNYSAAYRDNLELVLKGINIKIYDGQKVEGTLPGAVKILPRSSEGCQKVVVGSQSGVVHAFGASRGRIETVFKTLPAGKGVGCVQLGGPVGNIQDKIFVAAGNEITGYTRKGKQFLKFDTNLTDNIRCMSVCGNDLAVCGEYVYNHYFECQDKNYYLSNGRINDMIMLPIDKLRALVPVLACQDRLLRVLKDSQCQMEIEVSGPATALCLYQGDGGAAGKDVVYGTSDGKVGLISIDKSPHALVWEIENINGGGSITCLGSYDMTGDGVMDLLVGRNDGQVEVYSFKDSGEPLLRFSYNCGESVTSVQGGAIGNARYDEVLVTTYSGWIFGLSAEHSEKRLDPDYLLISPESAQKILKLKEEVEQLEQKVARERETYQLRTYSSDKGSISAVPFFALDDSFVLHHQDASYVLAIQLQTAIDTVVLQSNVPVDLLDSSKNSAVVSYTTCDPQSSGNYLLATFRCQANTSRLEVKIRTIKGQQGVLRAYVTAHLQPKCCRRREYQIRPLSLHRRTHSLLEDDSCMNVLKLRGSFSMAEMHAWLVLSLPEVAERPPAGDSATLRFVSTFLGTLLICFYRRGEATFRSDNISTISILRDVLAQQATKKTIRLDITCEFNEESIAHTLRMIHPKLEHQLILAKKVQLVEALKDLKVYEGNSDCLAPEYQDILEQSDELELEFKKQPCYLERLYGMITDLYIDVYKFKGINVKSKVPALLQVLDHYDFSALVAFFNHNA